MGFVVGFVAWGGVRVVGVIGDGVAVIRLRGPRLVAHGRASEQGTTDQRDQSEEQVAQPQGGLFRADCPDGSPVPGPLYVPGATDRPEFTLSRR